MTTCKRFIKWSDATTIKFLDLYQQHECLWNQTLELYKNRDARETAIQAITSDIKLKDITVADIKNKIKTVRTMYRKELTLVLKSLKSGAGVDDIYKPKLIWFDKADTFLRSMSSSRNSSSNLDFSTTEDQDEYDSIHLSGDESQSTSALNTDFNIPPVPTLPRPPPRQQSSQSNNRKRKLADINDTIDRLNSIQANDTENEYDCFGKLIASQLKKMPELDALLCQEKNHDIIKKQRLQILLNNSQSSYPQWSWTPSPTTSHDYSSPQHLSHARSQQSPADESSLMRLHQERMTAFSNRTTTEEFVPAQKKTNPSNIIITAFKNT